MMARMSYFDSDCLGILPKSMLPITLSSIYSDDWDEISDLSIISLRNSFLCFSIKALMFYRLIATR